MGIGEGLGIWLKFEFLLGRVCGNFFGNLIGSLKFDVLLFIRRIFF